MVWRSNFPALSRNSARGTASTLALANVGLVSGTSAALSLNSNDLVRNILRLTEGNQIKFVDTVYHAYPTLDLQNVEAVFALGDVCSAIRRLPTSAALAAGIEICGDVPYVSRAFEDVWRGKSRGTQVSIKVLRFHSAQNVDNAKEILWKRVPTWMRLSHENIVPFHGVDTVRFDLALVYDWAENGNVTEHIASHPHVSRTSLLFDVSMGLEYLHRLNIPHGDLKGTNVAIDKNGHARLTGYGLAPINSDPNFTAFATCEHLGDSRWSAPEIMKPPHKGKVAAVRESKAADMFAFGMLAVEVFTGNVPFVEQSNQEVVFQILGGVRPGMPENAKEVGLTAQMWKLITSCWQENPKKRPTIGEVVVRLREFVGRIDDGGDVVFEGAQSTAGLALHTCGQTISEAVGFGSEVGACPPGAEFRVAQNGFRSGVLRSSTHLAITSTHRNRFCGLF